MANEEIISRAIDIMHQCYENFDEDFWEEKLKELEVLGYSREDLEKYVADQDRYYAGHR